MIPVALTLSPAVTAGPSDDGTSNLKLNSSGPSRKLSLITGTLILLIVIPLANVAVNGVVLKSTPSVSQTFSEHMIIHITQLPSADTGDISDAITVTLIVSGNVPPTNSSVIITNCTASDPLY